MNHVFEGDQSGSDRALGQRQTSCLKTPCEGHECVGLKNRRTFVLITSCVLLAMSGMDKDIPNMCLKYSFRQARWLTFLAWLEDPSAKLSIDASGSCGSL